MTVDTHLTARAARIEELLSELDSFPDPAMRDRALDVVTDLLALYGEGLERILATVDECLERPEADTVFEALSQDELVSHLLLLHDLHPVSVETRVVRALEDVRPYLQSHGGNVELLGIRDGVAHLRLEGSCSGCPSSTITLKLAIEEAVMKAAPDLERIEAEGVAEARPKNFVPLTDLMPASRLPVWKEIDGLDAVRDGDIDAREVGGQAMVFVRLGESVLAYNDKCADCGASLATGALHGELLECSGCSREYDVRHAGTCPDTPAFYLEPVPLLVRGDVTRVAVSA